MKQRNKHIEQFRKNAPPIAYTNVTITERSSKLDDRIVEGYAVIWGQRNSHGEKVVKGAYSKSITENGPESKASYQIKFRDEHGRACGLFEELREDEIGLYFRTKPLDNVQWANDLLTQLKSGTINNFSIGFRFIWDRIEWDDTDDSMIILEARLLEISAVAIPSDEGTYAIRAHEEPEYLQEDTEEFILSLPKSKQLEARKIITRNISLASQQATQKPATTTVPKKRSTPVKAKVDYKYLLKNF